MKRSKNGYTMKQYAYATRKLGGEKKHKKELALLSGYSPAVAHNVADKIEKSEGFDNAMMALASENGNVALKIYHEMRSRDLSKVDVKTLLEAITTLANAWSVYTPKQKQSDAPAGKLREIILHHVDSKQVKDDNANANA